MAQLRSHHLGHSKAFKNGILSELPRFAREGGNPPPAAAWTDNQSDLICNPPSENPGYGPVYSHGLPTNNNSPTIYCTIIIDL